MTGGDKGYLAPRFIYIARNRQSEIKLGVSSDPIRRCAQLSAALVWQTIRPFEHKQAFSIEQTAHNLLKPEHLSREWFRGEVAGKVSAVIAAIGMIERGDFSLSFVGREFTGRLWPDLEGSEVRQKLKQACADAGSQKRWAVAHRFSQNFVSDVINGKRQPGSRLLNALGLSIDYVEAKPCRP